MKTNVIGTILISLLVIAAVYLFFTSIERVRAGEVDVVMELGVSGTEVTLKPRPLVNTESRARLFFKQPKIPFLGIGYLKESFKLDDEMDFSSSFAYYTVDELTGKKDDQEYVGAINIEGRIEEIIDWELFITRLDPKRYNSDDNPYGIKYRSRADILAEQLKYLVRTGDPQSLYPGLEGGKEAAQTPGQKIDYWYMELVSRRNFIASLKDKYGFGTKEEYVNFLKEEHPWYWGFGLREYETYLNQAVEMSEYHQSPYSEDLSVEGYASRYLNDEDYLLLVNTVRRADQWERNVNDNEERIRELENQFELMYRQNGTGSDEYAGLMYEGYLENLDERRMQLIDVHIEDLNSDFLNYVDNEIFINLLTAVRKHKLELTMDSLEEYETNVISNISLDRIQTENVAVATNYIKTEYAHYLESDDWEYFSSTFSREMESFFVDNPQIQVPEEDVIQMVYFRLLHYYLDVVYERYMQQEFDTSRLFQGLYTDLINSPDIIGSTKSEMSNLIAQYLMSDDSSLLTMAGTLVSLAWNLNYEKEMKHRLGDLKKSVLLPYFEQQLSLQDLEESEELWLAAIEDVLNGADLSDYHVYFTHEAVKGDTLDSISKQYGIDGVDFIRHAKAQVEFENFEDQNTYNFLNVYRLSEEVYENVKDMPLKQGVLISVDAVQPYTAEWWQERSDEQAQREMIIKSYAYPWIDARLPDYFNDFTKDSPYIAYIEDFYGVRIAELKLSVDRQSIYSNPKIRQINTDFLGVFTAE